MSVFNYNLNIGSSVASQVTLENMSQHTLLVDSEDQPLFSSVNSVLGFLEIFYI